MITNYFGWRWVFIVNVPASAILVAGTLKFIGESRDPNAKRLDVLGTVTFSAGLALLIWALIDGNDAGWSSPTIVLRLVVPSCSWSPSSLWRSVRTARWWSSGCFAVGRSSVRCSR